MKHPFSTDAGLCPVCLLEEGLASSGVSSQPWDWPDDLTSDAPRRLTLQVRLGHGPAGSVFLVRQESPSTGLLRLKTWHVTAPPDFQSRFSALKDGLRLAAEPCVAPPLAAAIDDAGRPSVLCDFRQGVPVLDAVQAGTLSSAAGADLLLRLVDVLERLHSRQLAHGSLGPGNVLVNPTLDGLFLVDFGLAALLGTADHPRLLERDRVGLARLSGALQPVASRGHSQPL